jgi:hypothetical protein
VDHAGGEVGEVGDLLTVRHQAEAQPVADGRRPDVQSHAVDHAEDRIDRRDLGAEAYWASFEPGTDVIVVLNGGINRSASGLRSSSRDATMPSSGVPPPIPRISAAVIAPCLVTASPICSWMIESRSGTRCRFVLRLTTAPAIPSIASGSVTDSGTSALRLSRGSSSCSSNHQRSAPPQTAVSTSTVLTENRERTSAIRRRSSSRSPNGGAARCGR